VGSRLSCGRGFDVTCSNVNVFLCAARLLDAGAKRMPRAELPGPVRHFLGEFSESSSARLL
jgi:hypothetical protein